MLKRQWLLGALAISSIGVLPLPASADVGIFVDVAPPAPRYEIVPAPRAGYVWQPGYWDWRDGRHNWKRGYWVRERHGYYWHPNRWEPAEGRYVFRRGDWARERFAENRWEERRAFGDRDRDGIPNRYDRDRDGDGVPNRFDRAPDNPHRQ